MKLTKEELIKVNAAIDVVNDSILYGIYADIKFIKSILPDSYTVEESKTKGSIHCFSKTGIYKNIDSEDDEHWGYVFEALKNHFAGRFQEVFHNVCFNHTDFTIYLKERR